MWKFSIIIEREVPMPRTPIHPGEHVQEELEVLRISETEFATRLGVETSVVHALIDGSANLDAEMALRLGHFFGNRPEFWMGLRSLYELRLAENSLGNSLESLPSLVETLAA
jgi:addiction module HigA family antidote